VPNRQVTPASQRAWPCEPWRASPCAPDRRRVGIRRRSLGQFAAYRSAGAIAAGSSDDFGEADDRVDAGRAAERFVSALEGLARGDRDALLLFVWESRMRWQDG
jgi:hypothetical protein